MATETSQNSKPDERRRFYRIDDTVTLQLRRLDSNSLEKELKLFEEKRQSFCLMNNIMHEKELHLPDRKIVEQKYPDIAKYLQYIESRLDTLSRIVSSKEQVEVEAVQKVNLSAQGVRLFSAKSYSIDDLVEMRLQVYPTYERILVIGTIVWCIEDPDAPANEKYAIALDYTHIDEADREVLIKHIHNKQIQALHADNFGESE